METTTTTFHHLDDTALIQLCITKTPGAFDTLTKRYLKPVYSYVYNYVRNPELAEDLTQETFLRVYRSLGTHYDLNRAFKPWLFTIATNISKTALKKNQALNSMLQSEDAADNNLIENVADIQAPEDATSDERVKAVLDQAMEKLNPSVRQALILRHVNDLSYEAIAEAMQVNINTVRTWLKRGRESLKTLLEKTLEV